MTKETENKTESPLQRICPVTGQTILEELINSLTHGIGLLLAAVGFGFLLTWGLQYGNFSSIVGITIYGASLISLYLASTLYHGWHSEDGKRLFRVLDHACIYVLIAGTYTPLALGPLNRDFGDTLLWLLWGIAIVGVLMELFQFLDNKWLNTVVYLGMGWLGVIYIEPLMTHLTPQEFYWLVAGGFMYSGGCIFYVWNQIPFNHAIWHLFVMAGSAFHYCMVASTVFPS